MSTVRTTIQAVNSSDSGADLYLPRTAMRAWLLDGDTVTVQFGGNQARARVQAIADHHVARIRPALAEALLLPAGCTVQWRYDRDRHRLIAGPLIGVLLSRIRPEDGTSPFGAITPFFHELADLCRIRGGIVCAFTMDDVHWETRTLRALIRKNGVWRPQSLPLPQCIYNRLASRQAERSDKAYEWIDRLREFHIPFFNEQFLNKWHVHKALSGDPEARSLLPATDRYQGPADLSAMLRQHPMIYAKPANGSMGKGIYRIVRKPDGYFLTDGSAIHRLRTLPALARALDKRTKGKSYLLQQGLALIGIGNRPVDFRVLLQKNGTGEWRVTSLVARIGPNGIVSNVARGGTMMPADQALNSCGPWYGPKRPSVSSLKQTALVAAQALERTIAGHYAELGVDLGVDRDGRIWLLEINSKPSKSNQTLQLPVSDTDAPRRVRPSVKRLFEYASYVSGFPQMPRRKRTKAGQKAKRR